MVLAIAIRSIALLIASASVGLLGLGLLIVAVGVARRLLPVIATVAVVANGVCCLWSSVVGSSVGGATARAIVTAVAILAVALAVARLGTALTVAGSSIARGLAVSGASDSLAA